MFVPCNTPMVFPAMHWVCSCVACQVQTTPMFTPLAHISAPNIIDSCYIMQLVCGTATNPRHMFPLTLGVWLSPTK